MSSTNVTKLHRHETTWCQRAWTHVLFRSSSSSYIWSMKKITNFLSLSLSLKRWSWSSSCLNYMNLIEFLFALLLLFSFLNNCVWVSFPHILGHVLVARILTTFPSSKFLTFSKLTFLLLFHVLTTLSSSHSWCSPSSHSCCSSRSRSCYSSRSYSCCSKLAFLLFQAHILIALFSCVHE
jgi:hypothetical protein